MCSSDLMYLAPSIAIYEDGNEDIAWGYLNAAGIPDADGNTWTATSSGNLSQAQIEGTSSIGDGALFDADGNAEWCHLNAMHFDDDTQDDLTAEVRAFAGDPLTSSLFECVASESFENNAAYGSMLSSGLSDSSLDRGHATFTLESPEDELVQMVGTWGDVGGSLSDFTATWYSGVHVLSGEDTHGRTGDVLAYGRLDGDSANGRVAFLAGHEYDASDTYSTSNSEVNGVRVFLNSYFTADCDDIAHAPDIDLTGTATASGTDVSLTLTYGNSGDYTARDGVLTLTLPSGLAYVSDDSSGVYDASSGTVTWDLGSMPDGTADAIVVTLTASGDGT